MTGNGSQDCCEHFVNNMQVRKFELANQVRRNRFRKVMVGDEPDGNHVGSLNKNWSTK
jgi:hypothetical protein